jgi:WD40 repeat protein
MIALTGHSGPVLALAYSPDGRTLASAGADGTARLWDVATGRLRDTIQSPAARAYCVAFAPDGKSLAVGYGGEHGLVQWWDRDPLRRRDSWAAHDRVTRGLAFSPNGRLLVTGGNDQIVRLWNLERPAIGAVFRPLVMVELSSTHAVTFSPDGSLVAALSSHPASVRLWRTANDWVSRPLSSLKRLSAWGYALAFGPDGRQLALGLEADAAIWEPRAKQPAARWPAHAGAVLGVAFTPDGGTLLTGGADGLVKVWDPAGRLRHTFDWQVGEVGAVAFAPDGLTAAAGGVETILVWDVTG